MKSKLLYNIRINDNETKKFIARSSPVLELTKKITARTPNYTKLAKIRPSLTITR
jgi:hypothetical protein